MTPNEPMAFNTYDILVSLYANRKLISIGSTIAKMKEQLDDSTNLNDKHNSIINTMGEDLANIKNQGSNETLENMHHQVKTELNSLTKDQHHLTQAIHSLKTDLKHFTEAITGGRVTATEVDAKLIELRNGALQAIKQIGPLLIKQRQLDTQITGKDNPLVKQITFTASQLSMAIKTPSVIEEHHLRKNLPS